MYDFLRYTLALGAGGLIGYGFGLIQVAARRQNEKRLNEGAIKSGWGIMPGSGLRVALLLVGLVLVQVICPLLFQEGTQWFVSGGLVLGYGWVLTEQLRNRLRATAR